MAQSKHNNNTPLFVIYGINENQIDHENKKIKHHGSILTFNVLNSYKEYIGYKHVEKCCIDKHIQLRSGCFCNPGACADYLGLNTEELLEQHQRGHKCWNQLEFINNKPTGAVRISFGINTTLEEIDQFLLFMRSCFCLDELNFEPIQLYNNPNIDSFYIYS